MNIKKTLAIVLALMLALSLAACGERKDAGPVDPQPEATATNEPVLEDDTTTDTPEEPTEPETTDEPATVDEPADESIGGVQTDTTYTNAALGISFTLPEGWRFGTQEEIIASMELGADMIMDDPEAFKEAVKEQPNFTDVMALDTKGVNNFNINYSDLSQDALGALMSVETYASAVESEYKNMEAFQGADISVGSHTLAGQTYVTVNLDLTSIGLGMYLRQYLKKLGSDYLTVITITGESMEHVDKIATVFTAIS